MKTAKIDSYYLAFYMNMSYRKRPQFGASVGNAQGVINTAVLKNGKYDRINRNEFVGFAKQIDKS